MEANPPESGFDELMRLSRETARKGEELTKREQQRAQQRQKVQGVMQGLREIKFSVAVEQLRLVAVPEITEGIISLSHEHDTQGLRKLVSEMTDELEKQVDSFSAADPDIAPIERSVKTLVILIDLFFSLQ